MPALTNQYLTEMLLRVGAPAGIVHYVPPGNQLLPLLGHANLELGDVSGIAVAPLMNALLKSCVTASPAGKPAPLSDCSANSVDEPYSNLASLHVRIVEPVQSTSDLPDEVLQCPPPESRDNFGDI